ncbi:hypothetical protein B0H13DRAFT_2359116 [Mycena leptocephala]|nr:hypothetical protein B0H13DRAFT_2359116 [Mycena leptocephala]
MLLDTFWHVFRLVDGHPSADFIMLWESLHDDIPKDPMDEQHELPLSRYQGDRPDAMLQMEYRDAGPYFVALCL